MTLVKKIKKSSHFCEFSTSIIVLFEIHQISNGHFLNKLYNCFKQVSSIFNEKNYQGSDYLFRSDLQRFRKRFQQLEGNGGVL